MENKKTIISWQTLEFEYKHKSSDWFWSLWIIALAIIAISVMYGNVLLAVLVLVASFTISLQATQKPKMINVEINQIGIKLDDEMHTYNELTSYGIIKNKKETKLVVRTNKAMTPYMVLVLDDDIDEDVLDDFLFQFIERKETQEPVRHQITKHI